MPKTAYEQNYPNAEPQIAPEAVSVGGIRRFIDRFRRGDSQTTDPAPTEAQSVEQSYVAETDIAPPEAENYKVLKSLTSDEALQEISAEVDEVMTEPEMVEIAGLVAQKDALNEEARTADRELGYQAAKVIYEQSDTINEYLMSPGVVSDFMRYTKLSDAAAKAQRGRREVDSESVEAKQLVGLLAEVQVDPSDKDAPFANYKDNNDSAWQYVEDSAVRQYLAPRRFVDTHSIGMGCNSITVNKATNLPYEVPLSAVVSAAGFDSWEGRNPRTNKGWSSKYGAGTMQSLSVIKHYAGLNTELPPVDKMSVYVQPDGQIFCDNGAGDSHRIAAAMLRGQSTIKANELEFVLLKDNVLRSHN